MGRQHLKQQMLSSSQRKVLRGHLNTVEGPMFPQLRALPSLAEDQGLVLFPAPTWPLSPPVSVDSMYSFGLSG